MDKLRTAVLFSGGKDSTLALHYAMHHTDVKCLIIMVSENTESYMFHTPNIMWAEEQAKAIGIPYIIQKTEGSKEKELKDLEKAIKTAISEHGIQGIITGAIESIYQASRVQKITNKLNIECFNPLWQHDQISLLKELVKNHFDVMIVGTFADGMEKLIGRKIDESTIHELEKLKHSHKINPAGEGGEFESFVLNAPIFKRPLKIESMIISKDGVARVLNIKRLI